MTYTTAETAGVRFDAYPMTKRNCACGIDDNCVVQLKFYRYVQYFPARIIVAIPNLFSGCSAIESVRLSSLICFFNQSCVNMIMELLTEEWERLPDTPILPSNVSQYSPDALMGTIIDNLMVDQWNENVQYKRYYNQCKPFQCSYTVTTRGSLVYILSTIIGIFGGLTVTLKIISQTIVTTVRNRMRSQTGNTNTTGKS